jgi:gliding motility associated protien GldN
MNLKVAAGFLITCLLVSGFASAQRRGSSYGSGGGSSYGSGGSTGTNNSGGGGSSYGNNNQNQGSDKPKSKSGIEYRTVSGNSGSAFDSVLPSKRPEAIERNLDKGRIPLTFEHIREDDAVYRTRVWREIDTREKMNSAFRNSWEEDNGKQAFIMIILNAIKEGKVIAFDPTDDRFTTPMKVEQVMKVFGGGIDTIPVMSLTKEDEIEYYEIRPREFDPDSIYQYRIKEEWVFDKESSRMFVRILGICPVKAQYGSMGNFIGMIPLFWVYYPTELRPLLAEYEAYNPKNFGAKMTWEELFENRMFSSYVTKSTLDNPYNRNIREYIKDPILRLLEGDRIMDKIFTYEQNQWSY